MLTVEITVLVMVSVGLVAWPLFRWSALQLAPGAKPATVRRELQKHPRLAAMVRSRLDASELTGLALTTAATVVVVGAVAFGLIVVMIRDHQGFASFDMSATDFAARHATPESTTILRAFTQLGGAVVLVPLAVGVCLLSVRRHGLPTSLAFLTLTVGGQFAVADIIKWLVDRARPDVNRLTGFSGPLLPVWTRNCVRVLLRRFRFAHRRRPLVSGASHPGFCRSGSGGWNRIDPGLPRRSLDDGCSRRSGARMDLVCTVLDCVRRTRAAVRRSSRATGEGGRLPRRPDRA